MCIILYCTILHYTALAVVNLWIISPLPRGSVNSVTCSSEKFPRAFCSRLVGSDVETPLLNMLCANSWMQTLDKSKPRKKRHRRNKRWTQYTCTYNYIHVMRVTMIGNVSTKPCNLSMQVTFGAPSSSAGSSSSSSSSTAALWDPPVMERKHVQLPWHHVFHLNIRSRIMNDLGKQGPSIPRPNHFHYMTMNDSFLSALEWLGFDILIS